jgi:hypothetical protein
MTARGMSGGAQQNYPWRLLRKKFDKFFSDAGLI